jgi:hypothetical protein
MRKLLEGETKIAVEPADGSGKGRLAAVDAVGAEADHDAIMSDLERRVDETRAAALEDKRTGRTGKTRFSPE